MKLLIILITVTSLISCTNLAPSPVLTTAHQHTEALYENKKYDEVCQSVFSELKKNVKIGMTSEQFAKAINIDWLQKAHIETVGPIAGFIPLEPDATSVCYCAHLYPNSDQRSKYVIYFRITKTQDYSEGGVQFLKGELSRASITLKEFALCSPRDNPQGTRPIERFTRTSK